MNQKYRECWVKNRESRNTWNMKIGGVTLGSWWRWKMLEYLCQTGGHDNMYNLTSTNPRFGSASTCWWPLRSHSNFGEGISQMTDPCCSPTGLSNWRASCVVVYQPKKNPPLKFCVSNFHQITTPLVLSPQTELKRTSVFSPSLVRDHTRGPRTEKKTQKKNGDNYCTECPWQLGVFSESTE